MRVLSFLIIILVFSTVLVSAGSILKISVDNEHSLIAYVDKRLAADSLALNVPVVLGESTISPAECQNRFNQLMVDYHHSIVEYLTINRQKHTLEDLIELADNMNVANYRGTERQNLLMLRNMLVKFGALPAECAIKDTA